MTYIEEATDLLRTFCEKEGVTGAFTATRSGNFICGILPKGQHQDTFVAMTAIIHGGAETISMEMKRPLSSVTVRLDQGTMTVISLGSKAILAITGKDDEGPGLDKVRDLAKSLEKHIQ